MKKAKVVRFIEDLSWMFDVRSYETTVSFSDKPQGSTAAEIETDHEYRRITITIYPEFWTQTPKEQAAILLHEMCHTIVDRVSDLLHGTITGRRHVSERQADFAMEHATTQIEQMLTVFLTGHGKHYKKVYQSYYK